MMGYRSPTLSDAGCPSKAVMSARKIDWAELRLTVANAAASVMPMPMKVAPPPNVANLVKPAIDGATLWRNVPKFSTGAMFCNCSPYVKVDSSNRQKLDFKFTCARLRDKFVRIWRAARTVPG